LIIVQLFKKFTATTARKFNILVWKHNKKRLLGRYKCGREDNIKIDFENLVVKMYTGQGA
jgi:hypothetical protein